MTGFTGIAYPRPHVIKVPLQHIDVTHYVHSDASYAVGSTLQPTRFWLTELLN